MTDLAETSRFLATVTRLYDALAVAAANSWPKRGVGAAGRWASGSRIVRWFVADPEPDVIVVDLTETRTLGPFIPLLDALDARIRNRWRESGLQAISHRIDETFGDAPVRAVGSLTAGFVLAVLLVEAASGGLSSTALGTAGLVGGVALLATRVETSAADLRRSYTWRALERLFTPPPASPGSPAVRGADEGTDRSATDDGDDEPLDT